MTRSLPAVAAAVVVAALALCSPVPQVRACATGERPPIVVDMARCDRGDSDVDEYSAPAHDISEDDAPVVGEPLDGDFWDARDRLDLDEVRPSTSRPRTPAATTPRRHR